MLRSYKIEGVVIRRVNFGEADKILTIFTKEKGKIVVLAKGIRKITSRKAPHLELFSHIKAFIVNGRTFDLVTEVETIKTFSYLCSDIKRIAYGYQLAEIIDRLCAERQDYQEIFDLLKAVFRKMDNKMLLNFELLINEFKSKFLWELGFLERGRFLSEKAIDNYLEKVMEKNIKSKCLLEKL